MCGGIIASEGPTALLWTEAAEMGASAWSWGPAAGWPAVAPWRNGEEEEVDDDDFFDDEDDDDLDDDFEDEDVDLDDDDEFDDDDLDVDLDEDDEL